MSISIHRRAKDSSKRGFTMVEMLVAMLVLAIAALGGAAMIALGMQRSGTLRTDTTATNVSQTVLEAIASVQARNDTTVTILDCAGQNVAITTTTAVGGVGAPVWAGGGPPGINPGDIDFTAATVAGYSAVYLACAPGGLQLPYDVRWRIDPVGAPDPSSPGPAPLFFSKMVTVAAQQAGSNNPNKIVLYSAPVTLRSVVGN